jgi:hypothetical protein
MRWSPRKSVRIGKGFRVNLSRKGVGWSAGIPGFMRFGRGGDGRSRTSVGRGLLRWEKQSGGAKGERGCGCGGCLLLMLVAVGVITIVGRFMAPPMSPTAPPLTAEQPEPPNSHSPKIPLFRTPQQAAAVPLELGLKDIVSGKPLWRDDGSGGWYALSSVITYRGKQSKVGDVDNTIECLHESNSRSRVDRATWTARVFNPDDQAVTLPKFKEICLKYVTKLGCKMPPNLFVDVNPETGQTRETDEGTFEIQKLAFKLGFGWQFRVTSK